MSRNTLVNSIMLMLWYYDCLFDQICSLHAMYITIYWLNQPISFNSSIVTNIIYSMYTVLASNIIYCKYIVLTV